MTIRHLKTFVAVCECGGITKAAETLHIAQPAVSQTIAEIEKYYGIILFDRINQRLVITELGKELLLKAKEAVACFDDFEKYAAQSEINATIRIGASLTIGKMYVPHILKAVHDRFPQLHTRLIIQRTASIEEALLRGNLDFGIVEGLVTSPFLRAEPFSEDRLVAVCGPAYALGEELSLEQLAHENLLLRERGSASRDLLDSALSLAGLTAVPMLESVSNEAILLSAAENTGVAVLPEALVSPYLRSGQVRSLTVTGVDFHRRFSIVSHKNKKFTPTQKQVYDLCRKKDF